MGTNTLIKIGAVAFFIAGSLGIFLTALVCVTGCTLSFQNVSTHGTAEDLIDENQTATPTTSVNVPGSAPFGFPAKQ